ncbi:hypothetical protein EW026_g4084 [Hermanssonia centrifuga]|uniref:Uncharacterized protein n=1 Tax=Hermanssonia centrifuga TaxID=98765 RepID=A0A4V3XAG4_9APHY|nr:hypothetical protein EW026_g4084 [Hermanssonia centrifuga]
MARTRTRNENAVPIRRAALSDSKRRERRERYQDLKNELATTQNIFAASAREIAKKYGRTERWTKRQVLMSTVTKHRKPNVWNAFVRDKLNACNKGRAIGHRVLLPDFLREQGDRLKTEYERLTSAEKKAYREELLTLREERSTMKARDNPKGCSNRSTISLWKAEERCESNSLIHAACSPESDQFASACARTGCEGFFIAVRGAIEDYHEPQAAYTKGAAGFVRDVLKMEPGILTLKFESNVVSSAAVEIQVPEAPAKFNKTQAISSARGLLQQTLNEILRRRDCRAVPKGKEKEIKMNYDNYEAKIVEKYGVALVGFPCKLTNPANLGRTHLQQVIRAFDDGTCHWKKLSKPELDMRIKQNKERQAAGEQIYKARKVASRKQRGDPKSAEMIEEEHEDGEQREELNGTELSQMMYLWRK